MGAGMFSKSRWIESTGKKTGGGPGWREPPRDITGRIRGGREPPRERTWGVRGGGSPPGMGREAPKAKRIWAYNKISIPTCTSAPTPPSLRNLTTATEQKSSNWLVLTVLPRQATAVVQKHKTLFGLGDASEVEDLNPMAWIAKQMAELDEVHMQLDEASITSFNHSGPTNQ